VIFNNRGNLLLLVRYGASIRVFNSRPISPSRERELQSVARNRRLYSQPKKFSGGVISAGRASASKLHKWICLGVQSTSAEADLRAPAECGRLPLAAGKLCPLFALKFELRNSMGTSSINPDDSILTRSPEQLLVAVGKAAVHRPYDRLRAVVNLDFAKNRLQVNLHCGLGNVQPACNGFIAVTIDQAP
jgi:hypothetical protein